LRYAAEIEQRMAEQAERIAELENLSITDSLTGLHNRREFETHFSQALARSRRYGETGLIAYFSLDNLKEINDRLGHGAGDDLVKCCVHTLSNSVRELDTVGRMGGDEFCVLLTGKTVSDACARRSEFWRVLAPLLAAKISRLKSALDMSPMAPKILWKI